MIEFHDYDPAHPFNVYGEKHIIHNRIITLDYAPLKGSITISGLTEDTTGTAPQGTFFVNYDEENNYRAADQKVHFPEGYDGLVVTVDYKGVSTLLRATHMNEIRRFMEVGASELAARMIVEHERFIHEQMEEWRNNILAEIRGVKEAIAEAVEKGVVGGVCPCCPHKDDILPDEMDSGDIEEERQGEPVAYDGGDLEDESISEPQYVNDAGEIADEGDKGPASEGSGVSESDTGLMETVENSEELSVLVDGGEIA